MKKMRMLWQHSPRLSPEEEQSIPGHRGAGMAEEDLFQKAIEIDSKAMDAYFVFVVRCESYF